MCFRIAVHGECLRNHTARVRSIGCVLVVLGVLFTGCSSESHPEASPGPTAVPTIRLSESPSPAGHGVQVRMTRDGGLITFDRAWAVYDGIRLMSDRGIPALGRPDRSSNGLMLDSNRHALWLVPPGMYGAYRTQVVVYAREPDIPRRCEDVVETSLITDGTHSVVFDSEGPSRPLGIGAGTYRVRLCATGLDEADGEPEFTGRERSVRLHVSASRFRFQVWPARWAPGAIVRVGSTYARRAHDRVARARARHAAG